MFNFDDHDYIEAINTAYWVEEEEMKAGVHPSQILERIQDIFHQSDIRGNITFMDYDGFSGSRVEVFVDGNFYGVFDYQENEFESTPEQALEYAEMSIKSR